MDRRSFLVGSASAVAASLLNSPTGTAVTVPGPTASDPFGFASAVTNNWPDIRLSQPLPDHGVDWNVILPGGRSMLGSEVTIQVYAGRRNGQLVDLEVPKPGRAAEFERRPGRGYLVGADVHGESTTFYVTDARGRQCSTSPVAIPAAYRLDDFTYGILWAATNFDDALQTDDRALAETHQDLSAYSRLSASAVSREAAPGLNPIAHMWLGSDFCAKYILRSLPELPEAPAFWTRERRGEEAAAWLFFTHKYDYLKRTTASVGSNTRAFCIPDDEVATSPLHERILLFLAAAQMESLGIEVQLTPDPVYAEVEGFVVAPSKEAMIANWVRGDGMWHVDRTCRSTLVRQFTDVSRDVAAHTILDAPDPAGRLRVFADRLGLPWPWLHARCAAMARQGSDQLVQLRSRLLSTDGLDAACAHVASVASTA